MVGKLSLELPTTWFKERRSSSEKTFLARLDDHTVGKMLTSRRYLDVWRYLGPFANYNVRNIYSPIIGGAAHLIVIDYDVEVFLTMGFDGERMRDVNISHFVSKRTGIGINDFEP